MSSTALTTAPSDRGALRDPVLLVPLVVAGGLAIGWLGVDHGAPGPRVAADLALAWALVGASVVVLERPRWRPARLLLAAAAFAVLAADLRWSHRHALWTLGLLVAALWVALLVHLVLTFPEGRPWSRAAAVAIAAAYVIALAGQILDALVNSTTRDALSVAPRTGVQHAIERTQQVAALALAFVVLILVLERVRVVRGPARRAQLPLLAAASAAAVAGIVWLGSLLASGGRTSALETAARWVAVALPLGVVAGIVRSGLRRREASALVVELRAETAGGLKERLARALGDPSLDVAYRLDDGRYVDSEGRPVELPDGTARAVTAVTSGGAEIAALVHDPALLDEPALVDAVRATAELVLENERLAAQVLSQLAEVRASRGRIVAAADAERRRIERNLHDGAQQRLVALSVLLGLEAARADGATSDTLGRAQEEVDGAIGELRELARGIHPTLLRDDGLEPAVRALARRTPIAVTVHAAVGERLPDPVELAAYFLVAEALTNVVKHASATEASVLLERDASVLRVTVADNGIGGAHVAADSGLAGLRDRLEALDTALVIESERGRGTAVCASIPCAS
jgi:signal transduction histidine kinase